MTIERRRRRDWRVFLAFLVVVASYPIGLYLLNDVRKDADRKIAAAAVERAAQLRQETRERAEAIERSRRDVLIRSCREQNRRHDATILELDRQVAKLPPARRSEAQARRNGTVALLEAIIPHRDCAKRAERLITP